jgi:hypothetical protein
MYACRAECVSDTVTSNQLVCLAKGSGPRARVMLSVLRASMSMNIDMLSLHLLSFSNGYKSCTRATTTCAAPLLRDMIIVQ